MQWVWIPVFCHTVRIPDTGRVLFAAESLLKRLPELATIRSISVRQPEPLSANRIINYRKNF